LFGLSPSSPLSVLAVEFLPGGVGDDLPTPIAYLQVDSISGNTATVTVDQNPDPLSLNNRPQRILRVSPLVEVAQICQ